MAQIQAYSAFRASSGDDPHRRLQNTDQRRGQLGIFRKDGHIGYATGYLNSDKIHG